MNLAKNGRFRLCPPFSFLVDELEVGDNIPVEEVLEVDFEIERAVVLVWVFLAFGAGRTCCRMRCGSKVRYTGVSCRGKHVAAGDNTFIYRPSA